MLIAFFIGAVVGGGVAGLPFYTGCSGGIWPGHVHDRQNLPDVSFCGNRCTGQLRWKEQELAVHPAFRLCRDAAVYDDPHDDSAGRRDHECDDVPGRWRGIRRRNGRALQYGTEQEGFGIKKSGKPVHYDRLAVFVSICVILTCDIIQYSL